LSYVTQVGLWLARVQHPPIATEPESDQLRRMRELFRNRPWTNCLFPRTARHLAHLVEDLALLVLAHVPIRRRQHAYQRADCYADWLACTSLTFPSAGFLAEATGSS
jgi:hypothetical protein